MQAVPPRQGPTSRQPVVMRSKLMLEAASELVGAADWPDKQVEIHFRAQGAPEWKLCFFASDAPVIIPLTKLARPVIIFL